MKRFASHYLYLMGYGFLKRYVVEVNNDGIVRSLSPLVVEAESIAWSPGVIALIPSELEAEKELIFASGANGVRQELPDAFRGDITRLGLRAARLYPFDFTSMRFVSDTSVQLLDNNTF